jgi:hypothetical protein
VRGAPRPTRKAEKSHRKEMIFENWAWSSSHRKSIFRRKNAQRTSAAKCDALVSPLLPSGAVRLTHAHHQGMQIRKNLIAIEFN